MFRILLTFSLVTAAWVFFRADDIRSAYAWFGFLFHPGSTSAGVPVHLWVFIAFLLIAEWMSRGKAHPLEWVTGIPSPALRYGLYYLIGAVVLYHAGSEGQFIYFQF